MTPYPERMPTVQPRPYGAPPMPAMNATVHAKIAVLVVTSPDAAPDIAAAARLLGWQCTVVADGDEVAAALDRATPEARTP